MHTPPLWTEKYLRVHESERLSEGYGTLGAPSSDHPCPEGRVLEGSQLPSKPSNTPQLLSSYPCWRAIFIRAAFSQRTFIRPNNTKNFKPLNTSSSLGLRLSFGCSVGILQRGKKNYAAARIDRAITSRLKITESPRKKGLNEGHPYSTGLQYHKLNRQMVPHKCGLESLGSVVRAKRYVK